MNVIINKRTHRIASSEYRGGFMGVWNVQASTSPKMWGPSTWSFWRSQCAPRTVRAPGASCRSMALPQLWPPLPAQLLSHRLCLVNGFATERHCQLQALGRLGLTPRSIPAPAVPADSAWVAAAAPASMAVWLSSQWLICDGLTAGDIRIQCSIVQASSVWWRRVSAFA